MQKPDLFLLHFAGGNMYSFNFMKSLLENDFNFIPLELPGRGKRIREDLLFDSTKAVDDIVTQILDKLSSNEFVIYGHSMGANLGFLVISKLEQLNKWPVCFVASGNPGPNIKSLTKRYQLPKNEFIKELKLLGGIDDEIIKNDELFNFFEPLLRADFEIVEKNDPNHFIDIKIYSPIYAYMGLDETYSNDIENWKNFTHKTFDYKLFDGNHFFIYNFPSEMAEIIKTRYAENISLKSR